MSEDHRSHESLRVLTRHRFTFVITGVIVLAISSLCLFGLNSLEHNSATWFVALLVIILTAMTATAAAFHGLKLTSGEEAFGLPSGSVRALLAIGIMALLVVFGFKLMQGDQDGPLRVSEKPAVSVSVALASKESAINLYRNQGFVVIVTDDGSAQTETAPARPAVLALYEKVHARSANDVDTGKQLVTAVITLLTSVIGFYFGSRSVTDVTQQSAPVSAAYTVPAEILTDRKVIGDALTEVTATITQAETERQRVKNLSALSDADEEAHRGQLQSQADTAATEITKSQSALQQSLSDADKAITALTSDVYADVAKLQEAAAKEALAKAKVTLEGIKNAAAAFTTLVASLTQITAEG